MTGREERRQPTTLEKAGKMFAAVLPIVFFIGLIMTLLVTFSKINPLADTMEKEVKPDIMVMKVDIAVLKEKLNNIDRNVIEIKDILKRNGRP